ncbi:MAG: thiamine pyrophosphate-dependent enzyme [Gemmatimonadota bacterium]
MSPVMMLDAAVAPLREARGSRDVIITTMGAARESMAAGDPHPLDLVYVPSSMGQASSLGLGLAMARPDLRVTVVNGDGSMLMNLGSLVSIAAAAPCNLHVVIVDNGAYEVTGGQPTAGSIARTDLGAIARGCGIAIVREFTDLTSWRAAMPEVMTVRGPVVSVLRVAVSATARGPRSPGPAADRARSFMKALELVQSG